MAPSSQNPFASLSLPAAAARIRDACGAKGACSESLFGKPNVLALGVGFRNRDRQGLKELCIVASVARKKPLNELSERERIPQYFGDFRIDVVASGRFRALGIMQVDRMRPVQPGISIGHAAITAGTFGCVVERNGERFILSNNHVMANCNNARLGDQILQPGKYDGGQQRKDGIARLVEFVPIVYDGDPDPVIPAEPKPRPRNDAPSGCGHKLSFLAAKQRSIRMINRAGRNRVDCAIAKPDSPAAISAEILGIGRPRGLGIGALGMRVQKSGRTTGHTVGQIEQIDVTSRVEYDGRSATFTGQLMTSAVSAAGDSGAVVLDMSGNVIGLLFAGSNTSTLINPIQVVFEALDVQLA
jgi:Trypsin-like peptidase domain